MITRVLLIKSMKTRVAGYMQTSFALAEHITNAITDARAHGCTWLHDERGKTNGLHIRAHTCTTNAVTLANRFKRVRSGTATKNLAL